MDYSKITLGELLSSDNETIRRNAVSVLKQLQKNLCNDCDLGVTTYPPITHHDRKDGKLFCSWCDKPKSL